MPKRIYARWSAVAVAISFAFAPTALAAKNKLKVHGPKSVKLGHQYTVKVTGHASGKANDVVGWEVPGAKCKSSYDAEYNLLGRPTTAPIVHAVSGKFSLTSGAFTAGTAGKAYFCAYLINTTTTHTYKHAKAHWKEHH